MYYSCYVAVCPSSINAESEGVNRISKRAKQRVAVGSAQKQRRLLQQGQYYTVCAYYRQAQH